MDKMIARIFPSKTKYTPDDSDAYTGFPDLYTPHYDEAHISCSFTWDKIKAEMLADAWLSHADKVIVGGPAYDDCGGEFEPGMYMKHGYTITSRGCIRKCPFCFVPTREGQLRELQIKPGPWICDNNMLACSHKHIDGIFEMLSQYKKVKLLGGFDIRILDKDDYGYKKALEIKNKIEFLYIAFDHENLWHLVDKTLKTFTDMGFNQHQLWVFVLCGFGDDTPEKAWERCERVIAYGGVPFASYFKPPEALIRKKPKEWAAMTGEWTHLPIIYKRVKRDGLKYHKYVRGFFYRQQKEK